MSETVCPLCEKPRPRGALRCVCNYTFEYDRPRGGAFGGRRTSGKLESVLLAVSILAGSVALVLARDVEHPPDSPWVAPVLALIGLFTLFGAFTGARWFLGNRRARAFLWLFGAAGARVFYALLGGAFMGFGGGLLL